MIMEPIEALAGTPTGPRDKAGSGTKGLDDILGGGFPRSRVYLVEGIPGTGKTTLGLQFMLEGRLQGEKCLYISLSETANELQESAESHGWTLDGIHIRELVAAEEKLAP